MELVTHCRGCGAEIIFVLLPSGKSMPVNPVPVKYWASRAGETAVYTRGGKRIRCNLSGNEAYCDGYAYVPHWGSCSGADRLRRQKPRKHEETPAEKALRERIAKERAEAEARKAKAEARAETERLRRAAERAQISLFER